MLVAAVLGALGTLGSAGGASRQSQSLEQHGHGEVWDSQGILPRELGESPSLEVPQNPVEVALGAVARWPPRQGWVKGRIP